MTRAGQTLAAFLLCLVHGWSLAAEVTDPFKQQAAAYWLAVDGELRWARAPDQPLAPASLTKIMTALLALESQRPPAEPVTVSATASRATGMRLGLRKGERLRLEDVLAATVVQSANDACRALAEHLAGSEADFVALMNARALTLNLWQTRFTNACGHDDAKHRSTARDLARLAQVAMQNPRYAELASRVDLQIETQNTRRLLPLENQNQLIGRYAGATGVKSGYTPDAGKCVVAQAERDGRQVLLVLLNAPDRWWTADAMLDYAFEHAD